MRISAPTRPSDNAKLAPWSHFLSRRPDSRVTQERRKRRAWYLDRGTQIATVSAILLDLVLAALGLWWLAHLCIRVWTWL